MIGLRLLAFEGDIVVCSGEAMICDFLTGVNTFNPTFYDKLLVESTKVVRMGMNSETI